MVKVPRAEILLSIVSGFACRWIFQKRVYLVNRILNRAEDVKLGRFDLGRRSRCANRSEQEWRLRAFSGPKERDVVSAVHEPMRNM